MPEVISVSRVINASPQAIFDLLADPAMHPVIDGTGSVKAPREGAPKRLSLGAKFGMDMRIGGPYRVTNEVVEFEEGKRIAWCHMARYRWRYELEPVDGGTKVTESFDPSQGRIPPVLIKLVGFYRRNKAGMTKTLENIEAYFAKQRSAT
jgi:uncharacterized protein YndB with AHSA1/START domain